MPITERTRGCTVCHRPLPDPPAAAVCAHCGAVHAPHHSTWPAALKWWLLAEILRGLFVSHKSEQQVWEELMRAALCGLRAGAARPNPRGVDLTTSTPIADLYPRALQLATGWRANGSPMPVHVTRAEPARR